MNTTSVQNKAQVLKLTQSELETFLTPLYKEIEHRLGFMPGFEAGIYKTHSQRDVILLSSENLTDKIGILNKIMQRCQLKSFGGDITETHIWVPINFMWDFKCGCNGHDFFEAVYTFETKTWEFIDR